MSLTQSKNFNDHDFSMDGLEGNYKAMHGELEFLKIVFKIYSLLLRFHTMLAKCFKAPCKAPLI